MYNKSAQASQSKAHKTAVDVGDQQVHLFCERPVVWRHNLSYVL
jgi:hypothetical protein